MPGARARTQRLASVRVCLCAGNSDSLVALLQRSTSAAQRMQVLECVQKEAGDTRAKLAGDAACLAALEEWVLDLIDDRMSFHILETLLKVWLAFGSISEVVWRRTSSHTQIPAQARLAFGSLGGG